MKYATTFHQGFTEVKVNNDYLEIPAIQRISLLNKIQWNASTIDLVCLYFRSVNTKSV